MTSLFEDDILYSKNYLDNIYSEIFLPKLAVIHKLKDRFNRDDNPISDDELEELLVKVPLELIEVSEALNSLKLRYEVFRIKYKEMSSDDPEKSEVGVMIQIYRCLIDRVTSEISFSRELVMSAKKIWDRRKETEAVNPVGINSLPNYIDDKTYIR